MHLGAECGESGLRLFERIGLAATKHRERAVVGGLLAEHDGRVEMADAALVADGFHLFRGLGRGGRGDADDGALLQAVEQAGVDDDIFDLCVGRDHHDDDLGALADIGDAADRLHPGRFRARHHLGQHVVTGDVEALVHHVTGHLIAHRAEPDDAGVFHAHT